MRKFIWMMGIVALLAGSIVMTASGNTTPIDPDTPTTPSQLELDSIQLPPGFEISVYASSVPNARSLELSPNGTLFVGSRQAGTVTALRDTDGDFVADEQYTIAMGRYQPNGVAFHEGDLYVAEITQVIRYEDIENNLNIPPAPQIVYSGLPDAHHGWKYIAFGPDGKLYVPIGAPCNICESEDPRFAAITRMNPDGTDFEIFARGVRNTVGFDWHPETGELWFTDNGRDSMGDNIPPDELNHAPTAGLNFGYPYCHGGTIPDPQFGAARNCNEFTPPAQALGPHVAALGMEFYTGEQFPAEYVNQVFIAERGSWDRSEPIGARVTLVRLDENGIAQSYEVFAEGWQRPNGSRWGRPVDVEMMPDGSLLVSDDTAGAIYRIAYVGDGASE
jgi:glucose/arabinose dehydrogenase